MLSFKECINLNEQTVYRGVKGKFDRSYTSKQDIVWVSTSKEHSDMYTSGQGEVVDFKLNTSKLVPLNLGFRTVSTEVKLDEVKSRFKQAVMDLFKNKKIARDKAMSILDDLDKVEINGHKQVWEWVHVPSILKLIKQAGFNVIEQNEGLSRHDGNVKTYGIIDKSLIT